jgi:hypothetical protein
MNDASDMKPFGSDQGEAFIQIKTHLVAKTTDRSRTGTVCFADTIVQNMLK